VTKNRHDDQEHDGSGDIQALPSGEEETVGWGILERMDTLQLLWESTVTRRMISVTHVKKQGKEYTKLYEDRQLTLF